MKIFKYSAIAAIVIVIIGIVACNKNNSENENTQTQTKDVPYTIWDSCYYFVCNAPGADSCENPLSGWLLGSLCYIDMSCIQRLSEEPDFPIIGIGPTGNGDSNSVLCLQNYSHGNEQVEHMFEEFFAKGEITFKFDCPANTPELMEYLPEGYLPAGTYPISKHGDDAWIDITSAIH